MKPWWTGKGERLVWSSRAVSLWERQVRMGDMADLLLLRGPAATRQKATVLLLIPGVKFKQLFVRYRSDHVGHGPL